MIDKKYIFVSFIICIVSLIYGCHEASLYPNNIQKQDRHKWDNVFPNKPGTKWIYLELLRPYYRDTVFVEIIGETVLKNTKDTVSIWKFNWAAKPEKDSIIYVGVFGDTARFFTDINDLSNPEKIFNTYLLTFTEGDVWKVRNLDTARGYDRSFCGSSEKVVVEGGVSYFGAWHIFRNFMVKDKDNPDIKKVGNHDVYFVKGTGMVYFVPNTSDIQYNWELIYYDIKK